MILARQEYTVAPGKVDEALAWLREVQSWDSYRLLYPHGCRIYSTRVGRVCKVTVEAKYANVLERLACLRQVSRLPEYKAWHRRQQRFCLNVYAGYDHSPAGSREETLEYAWD